MLSLLNPQLKVLKLQFLLRTYATYLACRGVARSKKVEWTASSLPPILPPILPPLFSLPPLPSSF